MALHSLGEGLISQKRRSTTRRKVKTRPGCTAGVGANHRVRKPLPQKPANSKTPPP